MGRLVSTGRGLKIAVNMLQAGGRGTLLFTTEIPKHDPVRTILTDIFECYWKHNITHLSPSLKVEVKIYVDLHSAKCIS